MEPERQERTRRTLAGMVLGAMAGCVGTVAMTTLQEPGIPRLLPERWRPHEFVPRQVVRWLDRQIRTVSLDSPVVENAATAVAHLGYGGTMGAAYGVLTGLMHGSRNGHPDQGNGRPDQDRRAGRGSTAAAGAAWGLLVWAIGYEGWLPAAGVKRATTDHPPRRWVVPIANHVLYGVVTALALGQLQRMHQGGTRTEEVWDG